MFDIKTLEIEIQGKKICFETGKMARQAGGSVVVKQGDTVVFASACSADTPTVGVDFVPLRVDYQEKFSSAGKTLGGFIKREGRPNEREILVSRLIDRPIRPLFPEGFAYEVQLLSFVFSYDDSHLPDVLAICATSAAIVLSDIPFPKPIAGVRVGLVDGKFIINPSVKELATSRLDLVLAGTEDAILMIEGSADFLTEEQMLEAIETGHSAIRAICSKLKAWGAAVGKEKSKKTLYLLPEGVVEAVEKLIGKELATALSVILKQEREEATAALRTKAHEALAGTYTPEQIKAALKKVESKVMRHLIVERNVRCDGRKPTDIRQIQIEQNLLPKAHGSSLFTRGETQALCVCTLGGETMGLRYENLEGEWTARFYMQYFFPPFSVGEVGRMGPPGRREVGHGKLAERALMAIVPKQEDFPYTIRLESNILESNGSSSMASVCGGCLALMDSGVPIKAPVSGIAMGLILEENKYTILSDILGVEDALGDMDFKVAGSETGITSFQLDIKVEGITHEIMAAALAQAKAGRLHILQEMLKACPERRKSLPSHAPRIEQIQIKPSKIGAVIGPGGKMIRSIIETTGVQVDINDAGIVSLVSSNGEQMAKARQMVLDIVAEVEVGKTYNGKVTSVTDFGAFVEILPGKEGLCHVSELDKERIPDVRKYIAPGTAITVKVLEINDRGQVRLSRKALLV